MLHLLMFGSWNVSVIKLMRFGILRGFVFLIMECLCNKESKEIRLIYRNEGASTIQLR
jgi:hypothetical protein